MASYISNFLSISLLIGVYHLIESLFEPNHFCKSICHVRILFSSLRLSLVAPAFVHVFQSSRGDKARLAVIESFLVDSVAVLAVTTFLRENMQKMAKTGVRTFDLIHDLILTH